MSTHNIGFYEELTKNTFNYHQMSSNTHLSFLLVLTNFFAEKYVYDGCLMIITG